MNRFLLLAVCSGLFATSAFAVDGQVLINQSTILASGGFPYHITQPGSYKLTGNLTVPFGSNGIIIQSSFVTIDLNGFNIASLGFNFINDPSFLPPMGISNSFSSSISLSNITIRNGSLTNWMRGIFIFQNVSIFLVEDITVQSNVTGGATVSSSNSYAVFAPVLAVVKRVVTNGIISIDCPAIISESVGIIFTGGAPSSCILSVFTQP